MQHSNVRPTKNHAFIRLEFTCAKMRLVGFTCEGSSEEVDKVPTRCIYFSSLPSNHLRLLYNLKQATMRETVHNAPRFEIALVFVKEIP